MAKLVTEHFTSIHQLVNTINERNVNDIFRDVKESSRTGDLEFTGTRSYKEAEKLFITGYADILDDISKGVYDRGTQVKDLYNRRRVATGVVGYAPHVPNAILGLPNSMIYTNSEPLKVKTLDICYCCTSNSNTEAMQFIKAGKVILNIINTLELKGIRVKLRCCFYCAKDNWDISEQVFATVDLKGYREQLDLLKMCFPLANPSMLRRIGFKWIETSPDITSRYWSNGYGSQHKPEKEQLEKLLNKNEVFISVNDIINLNYDSDKVIKEYFK